MPQKNYRLAKRGREESRKKRQQEKLERKARRGVAAPEAPAPAESTPGAAPATDSTSAT